MRRILLFFASVALVSSVVAAGYTPPSADELEKLDRTEAALTAVSEGTPLSGRAGQFQAEVANAMATLKAAQQLAKTGDPKDALREFLRLYDEGSRNPAFTTMRDTILPVEIAKLGITHPPAMSALRTLHGAAKARLTDAKDRAAIGEYLSLCQVLGDKGAALALFDQLPSGDPRRRTIGWRVYDALADRKRYKDALEARPYKTMVASAEGLPNLRIATPNRDRERLAARRLDGVAKDIEVLVGAGMNSEARVLCAMLLKLDGSEQMKANVKARLKRAGNENALDLN